MFIDSPSKFFKIQPFQVNDGRSEEEDASSVREILQAHHRQGLMDACFLEADGSDLREADTSLPTSSSRVTPTTKRSLKKSLGDSTPLEKVCRKKPARKIQRRLLLTETAARRTGSTFTYSCDLTEHARLRMVSINCMLKTLYGAARGVSGVNLKAGPATAQPFHGKKGVAAHRNPLAGLTSDLFQQMLKTIVNSNSLTPRKEFTLRTLEVSDASVALIKSSPNAKTVKEVFKKHNISGLLNPMVREAGVVANSVDHISQLGNEVDSKMEKFVRVEMLKPVMAVMEASVTPNEGVVLIVTLIKKHFEQAISHLENVHLLMQVIKKDINSYLFSSLAQEQKALQARICHNIKYLNKRNGRGVGSLKLHIPFYWKRRRVKCPPSFESAMAECVCRIDDLMEQKIIPRIKANKQQLSGTKAFRSVEESLKSLMDLAELKQYRAIRDTVARK